MTRPGILVFDSGVGGLSVLAEIQKIWPQANFLYVADTAFFPYGNKEEAILVKRVADVVTAAIATAAFPVSIIVIACNTASTVCLPHLRSVVTIPVVGTVPAIKPAAALSQSRIIGLLGTPGTVSRRYTHELIEQFAKDCQVIRIGSAALVAEAEQWLTGGDIHPQVLADEIAPFFADDPAIGGLDVIVLACTHFPLLSDHLRQIAPRQVEWIDSGAAIARRCRLLLEQAGFSSISGLLHQGASQITSPIDHEKYARVFAQFSLDPPTINQIAPP